MVGLHPSIIGTKQAERIGTILFTAVSAAAWFVWEGNPLEPTGSVALPACKHRKLRMRTINMGDTCRDDDTLVPEGNRGVRKIQQ